VFELLSPDPTDSKDAMGWPGHEPHHHLDLQGQVFWLSSGHSHYNIKKYNFNIISQVTNINNYSKVISHFPLLRKESKLMTSQCCLRVFYSFPSSSLIFNKIGTNTMALEASNAATVTVNLKS
jgi:hypothetical protein